MNITAIATALIDNGGRRLGFEKRQFSYTTHVPERRNIQERRRLPDKRQLVDRRYHADRRTLGNGLESLKNMIGLKCRREKQERRSDHERRAAFAAVLAPA